jgi:PAS domain S-box-containing protein
MVFTVKSNQGKKQNLNSHALPRGESEIHHILNALPFYVFLIDSDHRILAANEAVKRDLGMDSEQIAGAYCPILIHGSGKPLAECPLKEAIERGQAVEREVYDTQSARWLQAAVYQTPMVTAAGKAVYLHFARDITELKNTESELSRSLEHHKALCDLLQNLQYCQNSRQILEVLIDQVISLSWLGMAATAVGFLARAKSLEMVAHRNIAPALLKRCSHLSPGECLCGKVWETGSPIVGTSGSIHHSIKHQDMHEHEHVVLPIKHKDHTLGVLTLYLNSGDKIDDFRYRFLEAAAAAAGAALAGQLAKEEVLRAQEKCMGQIISSLELERKHIAGNLHDQLCQSLSAILLGVQSCGLTDPTAKSLKQNLEAQIRAMIDQVRQMAGQLRPTILDDYGLESALSRDIQELSARTELEIDYQFISSDEHQSRLPAPIEVSLYRVAMEALKNAISHAHASHVSVIVMSQLEKVMLLVEDDGCGFDHPSIRRDIDRCMGLIGMEERITLLGGNFRIESVLKRGTTVRAEVPIKPAS